VGCFVADSPYQVERGTLGDISGMIMRYCVEDGRIAALEADFVRADELGGVRRRDF